MASSTRTRTALVSHILAVVLLAGLAEITVLAQPAIQPDAAMNCAALATFTGNDEAQTGVIGTKVVAARGSVPAYCEVLGMIDSRIGFRVRLPLGDWNKRLMFKGCGGGCGALLGAVDILSRGYATATTDMGHQGQYGQFFFARNNRKAEIDFGYRSTHLTTVMAKLMIEDFYGSGPKLSYFWGGSTGGRQGLILAQRYPVDYDGIIVNFPALNEVGIGALHLLWKAVANRDKDGKQILQPDDAQLLYDAAISKCDDYDGLADGLIDDPRNCDFDPSEIECKSGNSGGCLTRDKVNAARTIYTTPHNSAGGPLTSGGPLPGSELNWLGDIITKDADEQPLSYYRGGISRVMRRLRLTCLSRGCQKTSIGTLIHPGSRTWSSSIPGQTRI